MLVAPAGVQAVSGQAGGRAPIPIQAGSPGRQALQIRHAGAASARLERDWHSTHRLDRTDGRTDGLAELVITGVLGRGTGY